MPDIPKSKICENAQLKPTFVGQGVPWKWTALEPPVHLVHRLSAMLLMGQPKFQAKGNESAVNTNFYPQHQLKHQWFKSKVSNRLCLSSPLFYIILPYCWLVCLAISSGGPPPLWSVWILMTLFWDLLHEEIPLFVWSDLCEIVLMERKFFDSGSSTPTSKKTSGETIWRKNSWLMVWWCTILSLK